MLRLKSALFLSLLLLVFSCKKSTSYQVMLYNNSAEQLKVKVYSNEVALEKDSVVLNPSQEYEIYYREEEGINSIYNCKMILDSVICYSATHKMKVLTHSQAFWQYTEMPGKYQEQHKCSLAIGGGDTIQ